MSFAWKTLSLLCSVPEQASCQRQRCSCVLLRRQQQRKICRRQTAIQLSTEHSCVRVIPETVAGLPLGVYEGTHDGSPKAGDHPLYRLLHDEPHAEITSFVFMEGSVKIDKIPEAHTANLNSQQTRGQSGAMGGLLRFVPADESPHDVAIS